ncbi:MAG: nitrile hydratase subunit alpha [Proteobacteria bacterium]|nr:nitrile hydratase subunit alpha [Burkholderiales bacterium]
MPHDPAPHDHGHDDPRDHGHAHDHAHDPHAPAPDFGDTGSRWYEVASDVMRDMLIEQNVLAAREVRKQIELMESKTIQLGGKLIARAWVDPAFRQTLLADGKAAAAALGIPVTEATLTVVEDTPTVRNVIVCTLCSCYPRSLLGQPPAWYRNKAYRSRVVREPRKVLAEFGAPVPDEVDVHVHDSNADLRFIVLPMQPEGTAHLSENELAALVTRDSLIGVAPPRMPSAGR